MLMIPLNEAHEDSKGLQYIESKWLSEALIISPHQCGSPFPTQDASCTMTGTACVTGRPSESHAVSL